MPLLLQTNIKSNSRLWLWRVEEEEGFFFDQLKLSEKEMEQLSTYTHIPRRLEWLASRLLLKFGLGDKAQVEYSNQGKPLLVGIGGHISISHSHSLVGLLFSESNLVGLDIERISSRPAKITSRFMQEEEVGLIQYDEGGAAITRAWCSKEALFKLLGMNCYTLREDFVLTDRLAAYSSSAKFYVKPLAAEETVYFQDVDEYCIALCVLNSKFTDIERFSSNSGRI